MKNNKIFAMSSVAVMVTASMTANAVGEGNFIEPNFDELAIKEIRLKNKGKQNQQSVDFAAWLETEKKRQRGELDGSDRLIVKYKNGAAPAVMSKGASLASMSKNAGEPMQFVKTLKSGKRIVKLEKHKKAAELNMMIEKLKQDPSIESVEIDHKRYLMSQVSPFGIAQTQSDLVSDADAANMTVCIIDSGYQRSNPDLNANNATGTNNSGTGNWYQAGGSHGTHVAGTIAGVNNSEGVVGVMPNTNVNLHIIKVFNASGWGYTGDLVDAVDACVANNAKVINMSLGGTGSNNSERNSLQAAADAGVLLVAASGNDGNSTLSYPASYDSVVAVGAVDQNNQHAEFSQYTAQVELAGPGEATLSTVAGDGRLGYITVGGTTYGNDQVVPQNRYVQSGGSYVINNVDSSITATLSSCTISGSSYNCASDVNGNICLVERNDNQAGSNYPEINGVQACMNAGASGVIVYSNSDRPGLQNPFLVDASGIATVPTVSVNRSLGQSLAGQLGSTTTLEVVGNQDYAYYNGTSMATPHVAGVAALAWSANPSCTAAEVRAALAATALDLDSPGRDVRTGHGIVQAKDASDYMAANCGGGVVNPPTGNTLENGVAQTGLSGSAGTELEYTMEVPAGATGLSFNMSGGTGDADLYVRFGAAPTSSTYDCRPYLNGNNESCAISNVQAGTYYVKVVGYSSFSGVSLVGSYTEGGSGGGGATGGSATETNISVSRRQWVHYTIDIPAGMSDLNVQISGGSGDADMYVRYGAQPTSSTYDCRPYRNGNNETCSFTNPTAGTWHISLYGYRAASGITLEVNYNP